MARWTLRVPTMMGAQLVGLALFLAGASPARAQSADCGRTSVGSHSLYSCVYGDAGPVVVLDAGARSHSSAWQWVVPRLEDQAIVLTYDRAGLGGSDAGPLPRSSVQIARELRVLLERRGLEPPFVLVGHSMGGWNQLRFARLYPELVRGIVLVDVPPRTFEADRMALLAPREREERDALLAASRAQASAGVQAEYAAVPVEPPADFPGPLPRVPLVVITADGHDFGTARDSTALERLWQRGQEVYAALLPGGRVVRADRSSHRVPRDRPDVVARAILSVALPPAGHDGRAVAITFDDLPAVRLTTLADARAMTRRLLDQLGRHGIPAVGFVNEGKLEEVSGEELGRTALLEAWLDAGHELGNHSYSHLRLYGATTEAFQADVLRGERVMRPLMAARGTTLRYFRHPMLNTGRDQTSKDAIDQFLARHGYTVAPVTIDNDEYLYAAAYDRARARADSTLMRRVGEDYVRYMGEMFTHYEHLSVTLLHREVAQILLVHANWLNADFLSPLVEMIAGRGYRFVSLEEALEDPAYGLPDRYVGPRGPSWLERWAVTQGRTPASAPDIPDWVREVGRP